jgi:hypothetical protein
MPALATLTIEDGQATPVVHNFAPVFSDGSKAQFADRSASIPAGFATITREVAPPSGNRTTYKITDGFYFPVVAEVDGVDKVVRYNSVKVEWNYHPESTLQERKDARAYVIGWNYEADVIASSYNLEPFF